MAIIYSYPTQTELLASDTLIGSAQIVENNVVRQITKNFTLGQLQDFIGSGLTLSTIGNNGPATFVNNVLNIPIYQRQITLTTTGSAGPATLTDGILNVPVYQSGQTYVFVQSVPATTWTITHNLNKYPSVSVVNINNVVLYGEITYLSPNQLQIEFSAGFSGKAYMN